jgi:hypothetical protein
MLPNFQVVVAAEGLLSTSHLRERPSPSFFVRLIWSDGVILGGSRSARRASYMCQYVK